MRIQRLFFRTFFLFAISSVVYGASSINFPASAQPPQPSSGIRSGGLPIEKSKSKVIPLHGKMTISVREMDAKNQRRKDSPSSLLLPATSPGVLQTKKQIGELKPLRSAQKSLAVGTTPFKRKNVTLAMDPTSKVPMDVGLAEATSREGGGPDRVIASDAINSDDSIADGGSAEVGNAWDSASSRLDMEEAKLKIEGGIRIEDIIEPTSDYRYSAAKRGNPFLPSPAQHSLSKLVELGSKDVEIPIVSPLQSFSLSQLVVIGVWQSSELGMKALVQTPTDQGIEVSLGDPAGNSGGRIMTITPENVLVREFSVRTDGGREYRDVQLMMGADRAEVTPPVTVGRLILRAGASKSEVDTEEVPSKNKSGGSGEGAPETVLVPPAKVPVLRDNSSISK